MVRVSTIRSVVCLLSVAMLAASAAYAQPNPKQVARRTIQEIKTTAHEAIEQMGTTAERAAKLIDRLQAAKKPRAARLVAHRAIERINGTAKRSSHKIRAQARRGIEILRKLQARPELIRAVHKAAEEALERVAEGRKKSVHTVLRALKT